jgi:hypothetical protein
MRLYRPVGSAELELVANSGYKRFPKRLPEQPIFYPVCNERYATEIASKWNTSAKDKKGYVLSFEVDNAWISNFERQIVGDKHHEEYWIPADSLEAFNDHILGKIYVIREF